MPQTKGTALECELSSSSLETKKGVHECAFEKPQRETKSLKAG